MDPVQCSVVVVNGCDCPRCLQAAPTTPYHGDHNILQQVFSQGKLAFLKPTLFSSRLLSSFLLQL
jgi:hypothetical protein